MTEVMDADVRGVVVHLAEASAERHRAVLHNLCNLRAALGVGVVDSGVAHLARRQFEGRACLRP